MMIHPCPICQTISRTTFLACLSCYKEVRNSYNPAIFHFADPRSLAGQASLPAYSLFHYEQEIRQILLNGKINSDHWCQLFIRKVMLKDYAVSHFVKSFEFIMPAPSSFKGRLNGQLDIAYLMANALAKVHTKTLLNPPYRMYFGRKKQSLLKENRLNQALTPLFKRIPILKNYDKKRILIVDDILTTGFTFKQICIHLKGAQIGFLSFAYAKDKQRLSPDHEK